MSQTIQLVISDGVFKAIENEAARQGIDPAAVATTALTERFCPDKPRDAAAADAFRAMFGAVDLGRPTGLDNTEIDADLAREYGRGL